MTDLALNAQLIATAMTLADRSKAPLSDIYSSVATLNPEWRAQYKDEDSFRATIRSTIHHHCPQSESWVPGREALFEQMDTGVYRVVAVTERAAVIARGRL